MKDVSVHKVKEFVVERRRENELLADAVVELANEVVKLEDSPLRQ